MPNSSTPLFDRLPQAQQDLLIHAHSHTDRENLKPPVLARCLKEFRQRPAKLMWIACAIANPDLVQALLDLGQSPHVITDPPSFLGSPLCTCLHRAQGNASAQSRADVLTVVDLLLAHGADPNALTKRLPNEETSALHEAAAVPEVLARLLAARGNVSLHAPGQGSLLDAWLTQASLVHKRRKAAALQALEMILSEGLDPNTPLHDGGNFLVHCWGHSGLRAMIPHLLGWGFDPLKKGTGRGVAGLSLAEHLEKKIKAGGVGSFAEEILTKLQAHTLDEATTHVARSRRLPRP